MSSDETAIPSSFDSEPSGASAASFFPSNTSTAAPSSPTQIGPYRILELLGAGGMGEVYKAEQRSPIRRIVAVKIIKLGFDSREVIARFESERQALARMDHPHVARVLDAGISETGRPYFVMDYVPGTPITQFADDKTLTINARLELFCQACEAIAHAHTKAIIHRDIKPSNVLAYLQDGKPTVKVIDFGVAKAFTSDRLTERTFNTERGQIVGTYDGMSPEQADGSPDIDTRSDVYSLGILLYELLTGVKPFDHAMLANSADAEIRRIIRDVEPPRPSTRLGTLGERSTKIALARRLDVDALSRDLRGELEWIPLKALRKERDRRYASPLQLAEDIQHYLKGEPLLAAPESRTYRASKFLRRNQRSVIASAVMLLMIASSIAFYVHRIHAEQSRTLAALAEARNQKQAAEEGESRAVRQTEIAERTREFLSDMLGSADPSKLMGDKVTVVQATQAAIARMDQGALQDQPLVEAAIRETIGLTLDSLGRYEEARPNLERSLALRRKALPADHRDVAAGVNNLAYLLQDEGKLAEAEPLYREALQIVRRTLPPGDKIIATALCNLASLEESQGKNAEAESMFREALDIDRKALPADDPIVAQSMNNLGVVLYVQQKLDEAEPLYRGALAIRRKMLPPGHPDIGESLNNLGTLLQRRDAWSEAEATYRESVELHRKAFAAGHPALLRTVGRLASLLFDEGHFAEAEPLYRELLEAYRTAQPPDPRAIASVTLSLAQTLMHEGKTGEAEPLLREVYASRRNEFGPRGAPTTRAAGALADLLDQTNRAAEATSIRAQCGLSGSTPHVATQP